MSPDQTGAARASSIEAAVSVHGPLMLASAGGARSPVAAWAPPGREATVGRPEGPWNGRSARLRYDLGPELP